MKHRVTFEVVNQPSSGAWLLHFAILLHQKRINPTALNWEEVDGANASNMWMLIVRDRARVRELVAALQATDGVRNIVAEAVEGPPGLDAPPAAPN